MINRKGNLPNGSVALTEYSAEYIYINEICTFQEWTEKYDIIKELLNRTRNNLRKEIQYIYYRQNTITSTLVHTAHYPAKTAKAYEIKMLKK